MAYYPPHQYRCLLKLLTSLVILLFTDEVGSLQISLQLWWVDQLIKTVVLVAADLHSINCYYCSWLAQFNREQHFNRKKMFDKLLVILFFFLDWFHFWGRFNLLCLYPFVVPSSFFVLFLCPLILKVVLIFGSAFNFALSRFSKTFLNHFCFRGCQFLS